MMQTKGKYYIWLNLASPNNYYWSQPAQNWTINPHDATLFDNVEDAEMEQYYADQQITGESIILQATRNI
jgi:hypothetical protein